MSAPWPWFRLESPHTLILQVSTGALRLHGFNTSPGDAKVRPGLRPLALGALVRCLPTPSTLQQCSAGGIYGKVLDTFQRGQRSLEFCLLSSALRPRRVKSASREQMKGRCAGHQLELGPRLPMPGALCRRTMWREAGSAGKAVAHSQLLIVQDAQSSHRKSRCTKDRQVWL